MAKTQTDKELLAETTAKLEQAKAEVKALQNTQRNLKDRTEKARWRDIGKAIEKRLGKEISYPDTYADAILGIETRNDNIIWRKYISKLPPEDQPKNPQQTAQQTARQQEEDTEQKKKSFFSRML